MKVGSTCYIQINPSYSVFTVAKIRNGSPY